MSAKKYKLSAKKYHLKVVVTIAWPIFAANFINNELTAFADFINDCLPNENSSRYLEEFFSFYAE